MLMQSVGFYFNL